MPVSEAPDGDALDGHRRVDLREGPARPGLPRPGRSWSGRSARSWTRRCRWSTPTPRLDEAFGLLTGGAPALLAVRDGRPVGIVTKLDLLEYLAHHPSLGG